jgi:hypothetical protein
MRTIDLWIITMVAIAVAIATYTIFERFGII